MVPRPPAEKKPSFKRQRKLSSALLSLSRSVQELTEENQSLKEDLDRVLSSSPSASHRKGTAHSRALLLCARPRPGCGGQGRGQEHTDVPRGGDSVSGRGRSQQVGGGQAGKVLGAG